MDSYRNGSSHRHGTSHASHRPLVEEQPGLEVYHPQPVAGDNGANAPEVYYSEDVNPSQYTFYREGTPTPDESREKRFSRTWGAAAAPSIPDSSAAYPRSDYQHAKSEKVCGIQRRLLWVVIPVIFFLILAIAIGIGVGVGVGRHVSEGHSSTSTSAPIASSSGSITAAASSATVPSSTTQTSSFSSATSTASTDCPAGNNTLYSVPGSDKTFLRVCGVDYSGAGQAVDLTHVLTASMEECMINCAGYSGCTGCGWGVIAGDTGSDHRCWLKNDLGTSHKATTSWAFAILQ